MHIGFHDISEFEGREKFPAFIQGFVEANQTKVVCEVGAGANPALTEEFVRKHGIDYTACDLEASEMDKAAFRPKLMVCDICKATDAPAETFDLVFSQMAFEHFTDSAAAHRNIWRMLKPGGLAVHCFPTLYALPYIVNLMVPERASRFLLDMFAPRDHYQHDKFPAVYHLCRGPRRSQIKKLEALGYDICRYDGYFGHGYYNDRLQLLHWLERKKTKMLLKRPLPLFTTHATVVMRKRVDPR